MVSRFKEYIARGAQDSALQCHTYIVAEAGVNHDGRLDKALRLVDVAAEAGADAVKFQAFHAAKMTAYGAPKATYQVERTPKGETQEQMLEKYELSPNAFAKLAEHARSRGIDFICTPFDGESVDVVASLDPAAIKVSSGDITDHPLLERIGSKGYAVILSSGMSTLGDIEAALGVLRKTQASPIVVLHCTSNYPANPKDINLRAMETIRRAFAVPVGYSDHTLGTEISVAAVAMGAAVIEKHFTLNRTDEGPDHAMSLTPEELQLMVRSIRLVEQALGDGVKRVADSELSTKLVARKSVHLAVDVAEGEILSEEKLCCMRPGDGIAPSMIGVVIGRRVGRKLPAGHKLDWQDILGG